MPSLLDNFLFLIDMNKYLLYDVISLKAFLRLTDERISEFAAEYLAPDDGASEVFDVGTFGGLVSSHCVVGLWCEVFVGSRSEVAAAFVVKTDAQPGRRRGRYITGNAAGSLRCRGGLDGCLMHGAGDRPT